VGNDNYSAIVLAIIVDKPKLVAAGFLFDRLSNPNVDTRKAEKKIKPKPNAYAANAYYSGSIFEQPLI